MHKIDFEQGSDDWLNWRKTLLTATDAPALMGASPYATPYQCWQRKIGNAPEQPVNQAMLRGKHDEPIARDWFNNVYGLDMEPCCIESDIYNFIGASLDGLSKCGRYILEIKSNGDQTHFGLNGGIPEHHLMQIQHQLLSADNTVEKAFYLSTNRGEMVVKEVHPDKDWMMEYLDRALEFWKHVIFFEPPAMTNRDYKDMSDANSWNTYAQEYMKLCAQIKKLEGIKESYRNEIIKMCGDNSCCGAGIKVMKKISKGRVDYDTIMEQYKIDTNMYRKAPSESWAIIIEK